MQIFHAYHNFFYNSSHTTEENFVQTDIFSFSPFRRCYALTWGYYNLNIQSTLSLHFSYGQLLSNVNSLQLFLVELVILSRPPMIQARRSSFSTFFLPLGKTLWTHNHNRDMTFYYVP